MPLDALALFIAGTPLLIAGRRVLIRMPQKVSGGTALPVGGRRVLTSGMAPVSFGTRLPRRRDQQAHE